MELAEIVGESCTLEAFCNDESAPSCLTRRYFDSYLHMDSSGHHQWVHPPAGFERAAILQYFMDKGTDPAKTSAIFVLPATKGERQEWTGLLKGMEWL